MFYYENEVVAKRNISFLECEAIHSLMKGFERLANQYLVVREANKDVRDMMSNEK